MTVFRINYYKKLFSAIKTRIAESPILYRLTKGTFWTLIGTVVSRLFTMISSIYIARMLGKEGFGEIGMVQSTLGVFGVFAGFGLGITTTKYIAELRFTEPERAGRITSLTIFVTFITSSLILILCLLFADYISVKTLGHPNLTPLLYAGALLLFFSTIGGVFSAALSGFESFKVIAKINILMGALTLPLAILLVSLYGTQGAITSQTVIAALSFILSALALSKECHTSGIQISLAIEMWKEKLLLWSFSLPAMLSSMMVVPVTWLTNAILVKQLNGFSELGLFNAANQWRMLVIFLPNLLASVMLPILSETHGRADKSDFISTVSLNLRMTLVTALPFAVLVILLSEPIAYLYGKEYIKCNNIIIVLIISSFLAVVNGTVGAALAGAGKMWLGSMFNLGWSIILAVSGLFLIPRYGGFGLSLAYLIAYLFHTIWQMFYVEIKLANDAIRKNKTLIIFSLAIMLPASYISLREQEMIFVRVFLVLISFVPFLQMFFAGIDGRRENREVKELI